MFEIVCLRDEISLNLLLKRAVGFGGIVEKPHYTEFVFFSVKCCGVPGARALFQRGTAVLGQHQHQAPCGSILLRCPRPFQQHHPAPALISSLLPEAVIFSHFRSYFPPSKEVFVYQAAGVGEDADPAHTASLSSAPRQFVSCNAAVKF